MRVQIKTREQLEGALGTILADDLLRKMTEGRARGEIRRLPLSLTVHREKPVFHLNDGDTLEMFLADLTRQSIRGRRYCGSADSAAHHTVEQLSEGQIPPKDFVALFVTSYWNGRNTSWTVDAVSSNLTLQVPQA